MSPAIRPVPNNPSVGGVVGGILGIRDEIADPTPGNPVGPAGRAACRALASTGFDGFPLANRTGPGFICEPYWDDEGIDPPTSTVPFNGGQCPTSRYGINWAFDGVDTSDCSLTPQVPNARQKFFGPIRGMEVRGVKDTCGFGGGTQVWLLHGDGNGGLAETRFLTSTSSVSVYANPRVTSVFVTNGPDDCGDPPPVSEPGPSNPGTPYGAPISIPGFPGVTFEVGEPEQPPGGGPPYWPITIRDDEGEPVGGPIVFEPTGKPPAFPKPPVPPSKPGEPEEPSEPAGDVPDDIPEEDEEEGFETIGYEWQLLGMPSNPSSVPGTAPLVLTTPYGNVQLRLEGEGGTLYSDNLPIRVVSGSIVRQDPALKVKGVLYSRRPDVSGIRLTPIRAKRE